MATAQYLGGTLGMRCHMFSREALDAALRNKNGIILTFFLCGVPFVLNSLNAY